MNLFKENDKHYCDSIQASSYEQTLENKIVSSKVYPTLIELLFSVYDHHYILVDGKDKDLYVKQRILDIATELEETDKHKSLNYLKSMNITNIQQGLQKNNTVSSLIYLCDLYKITGVIYIESKKCKIITSDKERPIFNILYTSTGKWMNIDSEPDDFKDGEFNDLTNCLVMDVTTKDVYKKYLTSISKYKSDELLQLAKERNIPISNNGKKKIKKELFDDINKYELNKM